MVTRTKKIFVGGLSAPTTLEDVKSYFEQFGPVSGDNDADDEIFFFCFSGYFIFIYLRLSSLPLI
jgi:RNA recognition motif-containing protein